ncbi:MAG: T9SS type A sorting domain-containing protein [Rufibacter sp.]
MGLPFFDDFAKGEGLPDADRWETTGGAYSTNRFAKQPPTIFAATFDGLDAQGQPRSSSSTVGPTDSLTSKPIDLSSLQPQDSLYLSFYWQAGGLLDAPNFSGSPIYYLRLEYLDNTGTWDQVWEQRGTGRSTDFAPAMLAIKEAKYFHQSFRFRWVSSGGQNGQRDVWHLDYVHLDKNRRKGQLQNADVALTKNLPSLLRRYTAMPIWQFLVNPANEVQPQVGSELTNLSAGPAAVSWRGYTKNLATLAVDTFLRDSAPVNSKEKISLVAMPSADFLSSQSLPYSLQTTLFLNTQEPNFFTRYNDTLRRQTELQDFYAYDDGTPEASFSFPSANAVNIAYQFEVNKPDKVKRVRLYFTGANTPGTQLTLRIWADQNGKPSDQPVHEQPFSVPAASGFNNWLDLELNRQIEVTGRFYVGYWQPAGATFVNIGFDYGESADGKLFAMNGAAAWGAVADLAGALMIRPVMAGTITSSSPDLTEATLLVYPNPSRGVFYVSKKVAQLEVFSLTGQRVMDWKNVKVNQPLSLEHLPSGVYLVRAINGTETRTSKLILQR